MIIKAIIERVPAPGENMFIVRIPFLEHDVNDRYYAEALLCQVPGLYGGFNIGDIVFVSFEGVKKDKAIILGKLYVGDQKNLYTNIKVNSIEVLDTAGLPTNTIIGDVTYNNIRYAALKKPDLDTTNVSNISYEYVNIDED